MKKVIDISEHNGFIDFSKVKASGINDVIIRIGWMGNKNNHTLDIRFNEYYKEAKRVGLNVGIYVFSYCLSVEAMLSGVEWVINQLTNKVIELPIFLDLEDDEKSKTKISPCGKENLTQQALAFCRNIENAGYKAGVYASKDWFNRLVDVYSLENYKIWLAEWYISQPSVSYKVDLWQYTNKEKVNGIHSPSYGCDCNYCLCENCENKNQIIKNGDDVEVRIYQNGSTVEPVYSDTNLLNKIGSLNPRESCECLGIFENRAIVRYKVDNKQNYKIGFVKWLGGVV